MPGLKELHVLNKHEYVEPNCSFDEFGNPLKYCHWCKSFEPAYEYGRIWYCRRCGHCYDYMLYLQFVPRVKTVD